MCLFFFLLCMRLFLFFFFFFFNDTATTEIYTLSLHDALPISNSPLSWQQRRATIAFAPRTVQNIPDRLRRSEEHTSELQSRLHLVCRLLLEKKKKKQKPTSQPNQHTYTPLHNTEHLSLSIAIT